MLKSTTAALLLLLGQYQTAAENNGLARTPPLGWNPWNCYADQGDGVTEDIVLNAAKAMQTKLKPSGYEYINLDCGWSTKHRDPASGDLQVNKTRFPHGMKWLADQIHGMGLKFGMYGALGYAQCCSGSADGTADDGSGVGCSKDKVKVCRNQTYYEQDAKLWASWGIDLLKFDSCRGEFEAVEAMRDALNATGRPIMYSVHSKVDPGTMTPALANLWRTGKDIGASYEEALDRAMTTSNVSKYLTPGPGAWADPDMLQIGNIGHLIVVNAPPSLFPDAEGRTQMALWCILKAPLFIGTFIHNVTGPTLATLTSTLAIAVNQDALSEMGELRKDGGYMPDQPRPTTNAAFGFQVWSSALVNGGVAAVLANLEGSKTQSLSLTQDELPPSRRSSSNSLWDVEEAFSGTTKKGVSLPLEWSVGPHDAAMLVLKPASGL